jgi:hypothetical protein
MPVCAGWTAVDGGQLSVVSYQLSVGSYGILEKQGTARRAPTKEFTPLQRPPLPLALAQRRT